MTTLKYIDKCSFCKIKNNENLVSSILWKSKIQIINIETGHIMKELSVCPRCRRKYSIEYLYYSGENDLNDEVKH